MKVAHALLSLFFLAPLAAEGATVNPLGRPLGIKMLSDDPSIAISSQSWLYSGLDPSPGILWTYFAFPFGPVKNGHAPLLTTWSGSVHPTQLAPHSYNLYGSFTNQMMTGSATLTFNVDGTWSCSGDCLLYTEPYNQPKQAGNVSLTTGTFQVEELPLPAASGLLAAGIGILGTVRRRGRRASA